MTFVHIHTCVAAYRQPFVFTRLQLNINLLSRYQKSPGVPGQHWDNTSPFCWCKQMALGVVYDYIVIGLCSASWDTWKSVLVCCVFRFDLVDAVITILIRVTSRACWQPRLLQHRENVPSAKLPQMRMSSRGIAPNFSLTPIWPGYPQLGCYQYHQPIVLGSLWWRLGSIAIN